MRHARLMVMIPLLALGVYGLSATPASAGPRPPKHMPPTTKPVPTTAPHTPPATHPAPPTTAPVTPPHPSTRPAPAPHHPHLPPPVADEDDQVSQ